MRTTERLLEFEGGRFTNLEFIAEGRQAQVYRADEPFLRRTVALKIVRSPTVDAEVVELAERLHIEGVASTAVEHPNLVRVHSGSFTEDGDVYLVMEWLEGKNAADTIREHGPFSVARALDIAIDVAQALSALHARGIVHGDVKPENIILTAGGTTKLIDLGQAHVRDLPGTAEPRELLGTPHYACPRYCSTGLPDQRSDVFSLAATFCSMIVGLPKEAPAAGASLLDSATTLRARSSPSTETLRGKITADLALAVERALAPDPDKRFATVDQFLTVLREHRSAIESEAAAAEQVLTSPPEAVASALSAAREPVADLNSMARHLESSPSPVGNRRHRTNLIAPPRPAASEARPAVADGGVAAARLFDALLDSTLLDAALASLLPASDDGAGTRAVNAAQPIRKVLPSEADTPPVLESIRRIFEAETPVAVVPTARWEDSELGRAPNEQDQSKTPSHGTMARRSATLRAPAERLLLSGPPTLPYGSGANVRGNAAISSGSLALHSTTEHLPEPGAVQAPASGRFQMPLPQQASASQVPSSLARVSGTTIWFKRSAKPEGRDMSPVPRRDEDRAPRESGEYVLAAPTHQSRVIPLSLGQREAWRLSRWLTPKRLPYFAAGTSMLLGAAAAMTMISFQSVRSVGVSAGAEPRQSVLPSEVEVHDQQPAVPTSSSEPAGPPSHAGAEEPPPSVPTEQAEIAPSIPSTAPPVRGARGIAPHGRVPANYRIPLTAIDLVDNEGATMSTFDQKPRQPSPQIVVSTPPQAGSSARGATDVHVGPPRLHGRASQKPPRR